MAYTPGPWHIMPGPVAPGVQGLGIFGADGSPIASIYSPWADRMRDNAILIDAAPDLLEACEQLVGQIDAWMDEERRCPLCDARSEHDSECPYSVADTAIAKAKGGNVNKR